MDVNLEKFIYSLPDLNAKKRKQACEKLLNKIHKMKDVFGSYLQIYNHICDVINSDIKLKEKEIILTSIPELCPEYACEFRTNIINKCISTLLLDANLAKTMSDVLVSFASNHGEYAYIDAVLTQKLLTLNKTQIKNIQQKEIIGIDGIQTSIEELAILLLKTCREVENGSKS